MTVERRYCNGQVVVWWSVWWCFLVLVGRSCACLAFTNAGVQGGRKGGREGGREREGAGAAGAAAGGAYLIIQHAAWLYV